MRTVSTGQPFEIELGASATAGYQWELHAPPPGVRVLARTFSSPATVGGRGTYVFRLQADQPGQYELSFRLKRQWEGASVDEQTLHIQAS